MTDQKYDDVPVSGNLDGDGLIESTPPDIEEFLASSGIKEKTYTCSVKRLPKEGGSIPEHLPGQYKDEFPEIEEIGKKFGPGTYFISFSFMNYDKDGRKKRAYKDYRISLGEDYRPIHDAYQAEMWLKQQDKMEQIRRTQQMKKAYKGEDERSAPDPMEQMKNTLDMAKSLGVPIGQSASVPAAQDGSQTAMMIQMMQFMSMQQQKSTEMMMTMMVESNKTTNNMVLALIQNNKPQGNNEIMKEVIGMVRTTVDLKNALNPEKQGVVDRVFGLMESAFPAIIAMAQKPREQRKADPLLSMATNSAEFQHIKNDPAMLEEMVKKWDAAHGPKQTDVILETVGLHRPGAPPQPEMDMNYQEPEADDADFVEPEEEDELTNPLTGEHVDLSGENG